MMCGKAIIVNQNTSTATKVIEEKCGIIVDANEVNQIKEAIILLRDNPTIRYEMGRNARKAYEIKYSWKIMERKLQKLYKNYE
jgi:glycosyltransferase involved in cell wall biosynthesis